MHGLHIRNRADNVHRGSFCSAVFKLLRRMEMNLYQHSLQVQHHMQSYPLPDATHHRRDVTYACSQEIATIMLYPCRNLIKRMLQKLNYLKLLSVFCVSVFVGIVCALRITCIRV